MFVQAKVLYVIGSEGKIREDRSLEIFDDLLRLNLLELYFPGKTIEKIRSILSLLPTKTVFSYNEDNTFISLPFMSSHFSIPIKENETVWIYEYENNRFEENIDIKLTNSFWLSRVHSFFNVENNKLTEIEEEDLNEELLENDLEAKVTLSSKFINTNEMLIESSNDSKILLCNVKKSEDVNELGQVEITSGINYNNFLNSSSSIMLTESNKNIRVSEFFENNSFIDNAISVDIVKEKDLTIKKFLDFKIEENPLSKELLTKNRFTVNSGSEISTFKNIPTAIINSSNIILASNSTDEEEEMGEIYLVKDSSLENYGEFSIRNNGKIFINSNEILIGNTNRLIEEKPMIYLGYNAESNSVVKGEYLKALLLELIGINKEALTLISTALNEIKDNFGKIDTNFSNINTWSTTHIHSANVIGATLNSPNIISPAFPQKNDTSKIEESSKENGGKEIERLQELVNNMDKILSKFVKTV